MKNSIIALAAASLIGLSACKDGKPAESGASTKQEAADFLKKYNDELVAKAYESSKAEWKANTKIVEGDSTSSLAVQNANEKYAKFVGSSENINKATELLKKSQELAPIQIRQLKAVLYKAAANPQTIAQSVAKKIELESRQSQDLYGFDYKVGNKSVSTNEIDEMLVNETNMRKRKEVWEASKEVGTTLKDGLVKLQGARNETVKALGYPDYFSYQVSDYGMKKDEMLQMTRKFIGELWPLYRELHTFARYELAKKYGQPVPDYLPAHWLPNRWGQDWADLVSVEGLDFNDALKEKGPEWLIKQSERFYVSLGFDSLPASFYEKSSLYPVAPDAGYKKNNHASAWHLDLDQDIRCLMSVEPNSRWYETTHHELGHIYYYISYTNPDVPPLLREGANRAFHEGVGSLMGLAAMQKPFLASLDLVDKDLETDKNKTLLKEALSYVVFMPFSAGVMTEFEHDLYANSLSQEEYNKRWWELKKKYQGITPPSERGEEFCDATSKTHINDDAAQYYDYALSYIILFQLHDHISKNILKQDPRATNYYGNKEVGAFLQSILYHGATRDWRELIKEKTGSEISAKAMLDYFAPLNDYLKELNKDRKHVLPEKFE